MSATIFIDELETLAPQAAPAFAALPTSGFQFSERSKRALAGVHEDLQRVAYRALEICKVDFVVLQGLRSQRQQRQYRKEKKSWIKRSRHLSGHAIDVAPWVLMEDPKTKQRGYGINFNDLKNYELIRDAFFRAANELNIPLRWGGDWNGNGDYHDEIERGTFDGGHFELPKKFYPVQIAKVFSESKRVGFASLGSVATLGAATDTLQEFAGFKAALSGLFGNVPEWFWLALILIAFAGVIWTKWHDGD